ncbi:MAG: replication-associated recombination protein A [Candidatus Brocadiia bacterium]|jgi:putative ATPase
MTLFEDEPSSLEIPPTAPLALRMRPRTLDEFVGQQHFFGPGKLLRRMLEADRLMSLIFYGPSGTGKSALAHLVARATQAHWESVNAATSNVHEVREVIAGAQRRIAGRGRRTVLFVDELHRFNRAQQDVLLADVENGTVILIAATTLNPFFAINSPLLSRSQIFEFKPLTEEEVQLILRRAAADEERGFGKLNLDLRDDAVAYLARLSDGDARRALNALEVAVLSSKPGADGRTVVDAALAAESIQRKALVYDRDEDEHYDTASAFIKSLRGSDPDAALYWLAKMLEGGEDPRFIARRMVILSSEDIGNAQPMALVLATSAMQACEFVGMPEAQIILAHAATYLACCPKSNASYSALLAAQEDVREGRTLPVPQPLRSTGYKGAERLGRGTGYKYAHDFADHWVDQEYVPTDKVYYEPTDIGAEKQVKERLEEWRRRRREGKSDKPSGA